MICGMEANNMERTMSIERNEDGTYTVYVSTWDGSTEVHIMTMIVDTWTMNIPGFEITRKA
jgi:hypothetical protein